MDIVSLETLKNGDPDHDYVIDDAIYHIKRAHWALKEGLKNPAEWRLSSELSDKTLAKAFPILWMIQESING